MNENGPFVLNGYGRHYERIDDQYVLRLDGDSIHLTRVLFKVPKYDHGDARVFEPRRGDKVLAFALTGKRERKGGVAEKRWFKIKFTGKRVCTKGDANPPPHPGVKVFPALGRFLWL